MGGLEPSSNQAGSGEQFKRGQSIAVLAQPWRGGARSGRSASCGPTTILVRWLEEYDQRRLQHDDSFVFEAGHL